VGPTCHLLPLAEIHADDRFLPVIPPPLQSRLMPGRFFPLSAPIKCPRPPLLFPFFPLQTVPPGYQNSSPESAAPAAVNRRFRRGNTTPTPPSGLILSLYLRRIPWYPLIGSNSQQIDANIDDRSHTAATVAPAAPLLRTWKRSTTSFTFPRSPCRSEHRPHLRRPWEPPEHHRRPPPGPLPRRSWPPWNPRWASPLSFLLHRWIKIQWS
jgi:hypothetical protein